MKQTTTVLKDGLSLYFSYIHMHYRSGIQYKGWFLMIFQTLLAVVTDPISTIFMFSRFGAIGSWSIRHILLMYAMAITSYGLAETFCRGFDYFPFHMVRSGDFDRLLLRPRSLVLQTAASYFHIHRLARVGSGFIAMAFCIYKLGIPLTGKNGGLLFLALLGGGLLYMGIFILTSGIAFYTINGLEWIYIFTNAGYQVTRCPYEYAPKALKTIFTFLIPIYIISYYPASVIGGWGEPLWKGLLPLPVGLFFLGVSIQVWRIGVRHYASTGS